MLQKRVDDAIERLKMFEPEVGYYLAFSGGKDSVVIKRLAEMSGVKFDAHYNLTTVDPPELVRFIKEQHPDVAIDLPKKTMWELIKEHGMFPLRRVRYCCAELKERGSTGRTIVTGVRWAESPRRRAQWDIASPRLETRNKKKREEIRERYKMADNDEKARLVEVCYTRGYFAVAPILDWEDKDVWDFIKSENIPYCSLYDDGFKRLGCIGCPMASKGRIKEFLRWPTYYRRYYACAKWLCENHPRDKNRTPEEIMRWWLELKPEEHYPELGL